MDLFLFNVISAFLIFAVVLPLFGVAIGLFCYYVMPYAFGGVISLGLLLLVGAKATFALWVWLVTLMWASAVLVAKIGFRKLGEEIEHYRAAHTVLLFGAPYRRKRNEQVVAFEGSS